MKLNQIFSEIRTQLLDYNLNKKNIGITPLYFFLIIFLIII